MYVHSGVHDTCITHSGVHDTCITHSVVHDTCITHSGGMIVLVLGDGLSRTRGFRVTK